MDQQAPPSDAPVRQGPPDISNLFSVKVDNIPYTCTKEQLQDIFTPFGEIKDLFIPQDRDRRPRGFAFVRYGAQAEADAAIAGAVGQSIDGREIRCELARHGRNEGPRRGPPGGGYGGPPPPRGGYDRGYDRPRYDDLPRYEDRPRYDDRPRYGGPPPSSGPAGAGGGAGGGYGYGGDRGGGYGGGYRDDRGRGPPPSDRGYGGGGHGGGEDRYRHRSRSR